MSHDYIVPEEIVMEIMLRVPSKSLIRFRSVCKPWCSHLSSSQFMVNHLLLPDRDGGNDLILFKRRDKTTYKYVLSLLSDETLNIDHSRTLSLPPYPQLPDHDDGRGWYSCGGEPYTSIVSSYCYDGLMCISYTLKIQYIILWRPTTGDIKVLPPSYPPPGAPYCYRNDLSQPGFGFGFDASSQDYKVFKVNSLLHSCVAEAPGEDVEFLDYCGINFEIYSFKTDSWRLIDGPPVEITTTPIRRNLKNDIFIWFVGYCCSSMLWFRLSDESFGTIEFPPKDDNDDDNKHMMKDILELNGRIAFIMSDWKPTIERYYKVWVLLEFGVEDSWTRVFTLGPFIGIERPLWFSKSGKMIVEDGDGDLVSCDPLSQEIRSLNIGGPKFHNWDFQFVSISSKSIF